MKNYRFIFCLLLSYLSGFLFAQNDKTKIKEKSYLLIDFSFESDAVFMGRHDSITAPYLLPSVGYYDKSGFFADATLSYLTRSEENRIDLFLATAGYRYESKKWSGMISGTKYFFNSDSYSVQSEIEGDISATIGYNMKLLKVSLNAASYYNSNGSPDIFAGLQLDRSFYMLDNNLEIKPVFTINGGSQYFYQEYYRNNRLGNRKGKRNFSNQQVTSTVVGIEEVSEFNILNLEISLPIQYQSKSFLFSFTPYWAFPQSKATINTENAIFQENLQDVFYWSVGIGYWFNIKK